MRAVAGDAVDFLHAFHAELHPAGGAVLADAAAAIVMLHDALADPRLALADAGTDRHDHPAGLVPGDDRPAAAEAERRGAAPLAGAVEFEVAAAHAGGLDLDHDLARTRNGIGKFAQLQLPLAEKHDPLHHGLPLQRRVQYGFADEPNESALAGHWRACSPPRRHSPP